MNFDIESLIGDAELDMDCPNCNASISFTLNNVGETIICPRCSTQIFLDKDESFDQNMTSANDSLNQLNKTLNDFGK